VAIFCSTEIKGLKIWWCTYFTVSPVSCI